MERLYSTSQVAQLLGGMHLNSVLLLIKSKKLAAKRQLVRGKGKKPRLYVTATELNRYIRELPDADEKQRGEAPPPKSSRRHRAEPDEVVTNYY